MLNATASRTSASNVTVTADGTQMALMTEPPQDGTSVQREAWRESVLADPNVLGDNAPGTIAQSSDSRHIFLRAKDSDDPGSVTDTASASPTATSQEEGRDRPLSDKEKEAIAAAEKVVKPIAEQVAPVYATYSVSSGQADWADSVYPALTNSGALMGADLKISLESGASETWPAVQSAHVTSTARVYPGRAPAVWVSPDLSGARVVVPVQQTVSMDGVPKRVVYPMVTINLAPNEDGSSWQVVSLSSR